MIRFLMTVIFLIVAGSAPLLVPSVARAELGGRIDSVASDGAKFKATRKAVVIRQTTSSSYTIQELVSDGNTVREFVSSDGVVFAVSWRGLSRPDLSQLLGSYYGTYTSARAALPRARRQAVVQSNNLVVLHGGHARDLRGQAVLSNLVPEGVSVEELQ